MGGMDHGGTDPGEASGARDHDMSGTPTAAGESAPPAPIGPSRMLMGATSDLLGGDAGDVGYPHHLVDGRTSDDPRTFTAKPGDRIGLRIVDAPVTAGSGAFPLTALAGGGARKDTSIVLPGQRLEVDFEADDPGLWMVHCHHVHHAESGMMTVLGYLK